MTFDQAEIADAVAKFIAVRDSICADGRGEWSRLAEFFTDDAVYVDPAWGRVEGLDEMRRTVFGDAMLGLDNWTYPTDHVAIDGDTALVKWRQRFPGSDGTVYEQSGLSTMVYAGSGKFRYEEDLLNMTHVMEDIRASGWRPTGEMHTPPGRPNRDFSVPPVSAS